LHWAAGNGYTKIAKLLISRGANVNTKNNKGNTPLHRAAVRGYAEYTETAKLLIENGADMNAKNKEGKTPLKISIEKGHKETADLLRKHGARK